MQNSSYTADATRSQVALALMVLLGLAAAPVIGADDARTPDLTGCESLDVPEGNSVAFHVYAIGVQIYQWDGTTWVFQAPAAHLFADPGYHGRVGIHYAGPTWESNSGSKVVGRRLAACTPDPSAIPWLLLAAASANGPGVLHDITFIQRVNTVGGKAPSSPGSINGEMAEVPYTAEYYFYRGQKED